MMTRQRQAMYSRSGMGVAPAGQTASDAFGSDLFGTGPSTGGGTGAGLGDLGASAWGSTGTGGGSAGDSVFGTQQQGLTPAQQAAIFGAVGSAIGTAGTIVAQAFQSGNALQIAQINAQANQQITALNNQAALARQQGNAALAAQQANQAAQLQLQLAQLQSTAAVNQQAAAASNNNMLLLAGAGLVAVGIIAYFATRKPEPATVSVSRTRR